MTAIGVAGKPLIFISYSSFDIEAKGLLERHLAVLQNLGEFHVWEDSQIGLGDDWFQEIQDKLETCAVAVLLISHDFLGSKFCMKDEVPVLLERRKREGMMIAPIFLGPCAWKIVPWLNAIQMFPRKAKPLRGLSDFEQAEELTEVVEAVHAHLEKRKTEAAEAPTEKADAQPQIEAKPDTPFPALAEGSIDLTRLPTSGYDVVGRDKELQFLNEAFDGDALNVVSLRAWGRVGKSTLVNKWCEYLAADNFRGARRVFAWSFYSQGTNERVTSADAFIDEALLFFDDEDPTAGSPWAKGERLAELVGREKALLILDGMEPLQDEHQGIKDPALARLVECLAVENTGLCVITTREPVKEFFDFPETTKEVDLEQLSKEAGRSLLRIKGLRAADDLLEQASEAFGNHALALNLLASYLKRFAGGDVGQALAITDLPDVSVDAGKHPRRVMAAFAEKFGKGPELNLGLMASFFDPPFVHPADDLREDARSWLLGQTAFDLRALGRLREAVTPIQAGLRMVVEHRNWTQAAIGAQSLTELLLALGQLSEAKVFCKDGIRYADDSGEWVERRDNRFVLANVLHQENESETARALFKEAEAMQLEFQPHYPWLYSVQGYHYCDLLLTLGKAETVRQRALQTLEWMTNNPSSPLLTIAVDHLSLSRAALALRELDEARHWLNLAVDGLREAGQIQELPQGLLARAAFFRETEAYEKSHRDLAEIMRLTNHCGMRLFECDAHLEYARLALAEGNPDAALPHFKSAAALVNACGYHRRDPEIAELKTALNS